MTAQQILIRWLGKQPYLPCWQAMQQFTQTREPESVDEIWLLEHDPVFTQGQNGKSEHILDAGVIPVIKTDRGGQVTYHGPGQLMLYTLIDIQRKALPIRKFVTLLEQSVIAFLAEYNIEAYGKPLAPGVYVAEKKICSIGLRVRRGFAYHGIAFNVAMNLNPFSQINPCGFSTLKMTQFSELGGLQDVLETGQKLTNYLIKNLGYTSSSFVSQ